MVVSVVVVGRLAAAEGEPALAEQAKSDGGHHDSGQDPEPGVEHGGLDELRGGEHDQPEGEHPGRMGDGGGNAEEEGVARGSARAHQVCAHDGFAVAGRKGVQRAQAGGDEQRNRQHAGTGVRQRGQIGEAVG